MADNLRFELVSPERLLMDVPVHMVVVPGTEGEFGVMAGHAPVMSTIRPGIIDVYETDGTDADRIYVAGGFAEVTPDGLVILAEEAIALKDLDRSAVEQKITDLKEDIEDAKADDDRVRLVAELEQFSAILAAMN